MKDIRAEAIRLIQALPEGSTWSDILHHLHIRRKLDLAAQDEQAGRVIPHDEVKQRLRSARETNGIVNSPHLLAGIKEARSQSEYLEFSDVFDED